MTNITFHLVPTPTLAAVDAVLPALLEGFVRAGRKVVVRCPDDERLRRLNETLWTFAPESFLPHGTAADGFAARQPVYLTTQPNDVPNNADVLVRVSGSDAPDVSTFDDVLDVFDGSDRQKEAARARWRTLKEQGYPLTHLEWTGTDWRKK
jgi:DNA polymerase-3 subunit chi